MPTPYSNGTPRRWKWYHEQLLAAAKIPGTDTRANIHANKWKWLYSFVYGIFYQRRGNGRLGRGSDFPNFAREIIKKLSGVDVIFMGRSLVPKNFGKAYRDHLNILCYVSPNTWEQYRAYGEIEWCSIQNDWYANSAFRNYHVLDADGNAMLARSAIPSIFECPLCGEEWEHKYRRAHKHLSLSTCPKCITKKLTNKTPTPDTIYGDYHSHGRMGWKWIPQTVKGDNTIQMGIELEMQFKYYREQSYYPNREAWAMYQHQIKADPTWNNFYCERDGSLGECGIEMITQPMSQKLHNQYWEWMLPHIRERFLGWNTESISGDNQYGIHITFSIPQFGAFNLARLIKFIEYPNNAVLIQGIAQRGVLYGANGSLSGKDKKLSEVVQLNKGKMVQATTRSQAVNVKMGGTLCEIRMFRSTLNQTSFMKNLEFLYSFRHWCGSTPYNRAATAYLEWLLSNAAKLYPVYPNLYRYLTMDRFPVKFAKHSVTNPWADSFKKVVETYQQGQKALFGSSVTVEQDDYQ